MKKLSLILILSLATSAAFARTTKTTKINKTKFDVRVPVKNWIKKMNKGFRVGIAKGSLEMNARARANNVDFSENDTTPTNFQVHVGWEKIRKNTVGYSAFAVYQDIESKNAQDNKENVRNMRLAGNATYGIDNQVYAYGGLNWGKYYGSDEIEGNYKAGMGYQLGLGFDLHKKANIEVEYLTLLNEGEINNLNVDVETKGIMLKLNTPFSFNI